MAAAAPAWPFDSLVFGVDRKSTQKMRERLNEKCAHFWNNCLVLWAIRSFSNSSNVESASGMGLKWRRAEHLQGTPSPLTPRLR